ncbi:MAG TPA: ABC-F family ATP-binding cassette domain-containing protein [Nocardioidaceae bacterium]|nr:ABC-F family ATP-binding cassette domain-containing protein [Nocardioidaceae bacterium]
MHDPHLPMPLTARGVVKAYGERVVLDGLDLRAAPGRPVGLVGENGAGKSTLLRLLAGVERPDVGQVARPPDLGYLPQEPGFPAGATVDAVLRDAVAPLHAAAARVEALAARLGAPGAAEEYDATLAWATWHGAWDADRRATLTAERLGLAALERSRPVSSLSGGQRSRLALAALLVRRPTCLLLDEPTNHLDDGAMALLEQSLLELPGVVVAASHDRTFLDAVCRVVVDLDPAHAGPGGDACGGTRFTGGYSDHLVAKRDARRRWQEAFEAQQAELDRLRRAARTTARQVAHNRAPRDNDRFVHHFKGENVARTVGRRVRDAERRIELVERARVPMPPPSLSFSAALTAGRDRPGVVVEVRDLDVEDRLHVSRLRLAAGESLLVTGGNGSGKSTLLKVLAGRLDPTTGDVRVRARRTGYLPQHVTFARPDRSARDAYDAATSAPVPLHELGLLRPRDLVRPVGALSIGQQRRLALAILVARSPDLVLLDEPTNHVSLSLAEELEDALRSSTGTVVVASHDRWLRRRWTGPVLALTGVSPCGG